MLSLPQSRRYGGLFALNEVVPTVVSRTHRPVVGTLLAILKHWLGIVKIDMTLQNSHRSHIILFQRS